MPIVSSVVTKNSLNKKGTYRRVGFLMLDHLGNPRPYGGMQLPPRIDGDHITDTLLENLKAQLIVKGDRFLKGRDLENGVYLKEWDFVLQENTENELLDYAREEYRNKDEVELVPVAERITEWLDMGRFTEGQVRSVFGMTQPEFVQFRSRMDDIRNSANTVKGARGE